MSETPIIVANTQWDLPENLLKWVKQERMINALIDMVKPLNSEERVGFAEVVAYMMPETQKRPLNSDWAKIYLYCVTRLFKNHRLEVPQEIEVKELNDYEMRNLKELREWIYKQRGGKERNPVIDAFKQVFANEIKTGGEQNGNENRRDKG